MKILKLFIIPILTGLLACLILIGNVPALLDSVAGWAVTKHNKITCWGEKHRYNILHAFIVPKPSDIVCERCGTKISGTDLVFLEQELKIFSDYLSALKQSTDPDSQELGKL